MQEKTIGTTTFWVMRILLSRPFEPSSLLSKKTEPPTYLPKNIQNMSRRNIPVIPTLAIFGDTPTEPPAHHHHHHLQPKIISQKKERKNVENWKIPKTQKGSLWTMPIITTQCKPMSQKSMCVCERVKEEVVGWAYGDTRSNLKPHNAK